MTTQSPRGDTAGTKIFWLDKNGDVTYSDTQPHRKSR